VGRFHVVEQLAIADCALEIEAAGLDDLFATAAAALTDVMVDPSTVPEAVAHELRLEAAALDLLLYDWLAELIYLKDRDQLLVRRAEVHVGGGGPYALRAVLHGAPIDRQHMALRADAKAVTLHQFLVEPTDEGWRARVVIDI
jgi:SHS2 domain-containing protein